MEVRLALGKDERSPERRIIPEEETEMRPTFAVLALTLLCTACGTQDGVERSDETETVAEPENSHDATVASAEARLGELDKQAEEVVDALNAQTAAAPENVEELAEAIDARRQEAEQLVASLAQADDSTWASRADEVQQALEALEQSIQAARERMQT